MPFFDRWSAPRSKNAIFFFQNLLYQKLWAGRRWAVTAKICATLFFYICQKKRGAPKCEPGDPFARPRTFMSCSARKKNRHSILIGELAGFQNRPSKLFLLACVKSYGRREEPRHFFRLFPYLPLVFALITDVFCLKVGS